MAVLRGGPTGSEEDHSLGVMIAVVVAAGVLMLGGLVYLLVRMFSM